MNKGKEYKNITEEIKHFLEKLFDKINERCIKIKSVSNYYPFAERERQLDSIMAPALDEICDGVLCEPNIRRCYKDENKVEIEKYGRVDYCVKYNDYEIYLELKHSYININTKIVRQDTIKKYAKVLQQINYLNKYSKDIYFYNDPDCKRARIALLVINVFSNVAMVNVENQIMDCIDNITNQFSDRAKKRDYDYIDYRIFDSPAVVECNDGDEYYHGLIFLGKVLG